MNILRLCKAITGATLVSFFMIQAPAMASVVDFATDPVGPNPGGTFIDSGDYRFSSTSFFGISSSHELAFHSSGVLTIERIDHGAFELSKLDVGTMPSSLPAGTAFLSFAGQGGSNPTDSVSNLSWPLTSFVTPTFTNLTKLTITVIPTGIAVSGYAGIDNLVLTPVPEPETYALLLAGLGLLAVIGRRRKALG